jgi:sarcosine oxidase gamma subunit
MRIPGVERRIMTNGKLFRVEQFVPAGWLRKEAWVSATVSDFPYNHIANFATLQEAEACLAGRYCGATYDRSTGITTLRMAGPDEWTVVRR